MSEADELEALLKAEVQTDAPEIDPANADEFHQALERWVTLRDQLDKVTKVKKDLDLAVDNLAKSLAPIFELRKLQNIKLAGIGLVYTASNTWPSVMDQSRFYEWLREQGEEGIIKPVVHPMTLKAFINQRIDDDKPLPPDDVLTVTSGRTLRLKRDKS